MEEIHGGLAIAQFWFGFGVDKSITTVFVKVVKNGETIAEQQITETTTMPTLLADDFANEDDILKDATLIAHKVAEFVKDPVKFEENITNLWGTLLVE